jgi:hypothetical protein
MKKFFLQNTTYLLLLVGVASLSSCKKGWFDALPSSQIPAEEQFSSPAGFQDALTGVYLTMTTDSLYGMMSSWNAIDRLSQVYAPHTSITPVIDLQNFNYFSVRSRPIINNIWNNQYNAIANINAILFYLESRKSVMTEIEYKILKGELLGLRVFLHLDLIRMFGHGGYASRPNLVNRLTVPYATQFSREFPEQLTYAETFTRMEADLNTALELLKAEDPIYTKSNKPAGYYNDINRNGFYTNRKIRMNYYAALALKARLLLWKGGDQDLVAAKSAALEVINDAVVVLKTSNPETDRAMVSEHLFGLNIEDFQQSIDPLFNANDATNVRAVFLNQTTAEQIYETNNISIGVVDYRYNSLTESQTRGRVVTKFFQEKNNFQSRNLYPLLRISELYYIAAEASMSSSPSEAVDYLNTVRRARGIIQNIPNSASASEIDQEIQKEYRKEFLTEGQLFFYYKRKMRTTFPGLSANITAGDNIYVFPYPDNEIEFGGRVQ